MLALDISNWGAGNPPIDLSAETVAAWKQKGVSRVIVGVSHHVAIARQQLEAVIAGGLEVEAYIYAYWGQPFTVQVEYARQATAGLPVRRLWVDFEDDRAPKDDLAAMVAWMHGCWDAAVELGLPLGVYSAWWWWTVWAGDTQDFKDCPLWVAAYDGKSNLEFPTFGGWQKCVMKQYLGTTEF